MIPMTSISSLLLNSPNSLRESPPTPITSKSFNFFFNLLRISIAKKSPEASTVTTPIFMFNYRITPRVEFLIDLVKISIFSEESHSDSITLRASLTDFFSLKKILYAFFKFRISSLGKDFLSSPIEFNPATLVGLPATLVNAATSILIIDPIPVNAYDPILQC